MALTKQRLEEIISSPLSTPAQKEQATSQLAVLSKQTEAKPEPESTADGNVRLRAYNGPLYFKAGGWFCKEGSKDAMCSYPQDIPARVISKAYAEELQHSYESFGGVQSPQAISIADMDYTFGRGMATTPEERAEWLSKFPLERRDLFTKPTPSKILPKEDSVVKETE